MIIAVGICGIYVRKPGWSVRGLIVAITWQYQPPPAGVVHPSSEYWGPLISLAEWLSFLVFGERLYAALVPEAIAGALLVALTYVCGRRVLAGWLHARGRDAANARGAVQFIVRCNASPATMR